MEALIPLLLWFHEFFAWTFLFFMLKNIIFFREITGGWQNILRNQFGQLSPHWIGIQTMFYWLPDLLDIKSGFFPDIWRYVISRVFCFKKKFFWFILGTLISRVFILNWSNSINNVYFFPRIFEGLWTQTECHSLGKQYEIQSSYGWIFKQYSCE